MYDSSTTEVAPFRKTRQHAANVPVVGTAGRIFCPAEPYATVASLFGKAFFTTRAILAKNESRTRRLPE
jgi:hypothetical protein